MFIELSIKALLDIDVGIRKKPVETGLYYLNSRYYDPEVSRFISTDSIEYINPDILNGLNLYAYCNNNPVMNVDPFGNFFISLIVGLAIGALFGAITSGISSAAKGNTGLALVGDIFGGALIGGALGLASTFGGLVGAGVIGIKGALIGLGLTTLFSFAAGTTSNIVHSLSRDEKIDWKGALIDGGITAAQSIISFGLGAALSYSGAWNSLTKTKFSNSFKLFRSSGQGFLKSAFNGTLLHLEQNATQMLTRTLVKTIFTWPWTFLRNNI